MSQCIGGDVDMTARSMTRRMPSPRPVPAMPFHIDLRKVIVGAPRNRLLRVRDISFDSVRSRCAVSGIRIGDVITCRGANADHVIIELDTGERVTLGLALSACVEVDIQDDRLHRAPRGGIS